MKLNPYEDMEVRQLEDKEIKANLKSFNFKDLPNRTQIVIKGENNWFTFVKTADGEVYMAGTHPRNCNCR